MDDGPRRAGGRSLEAESRLAPFVNAASVLIAVSALLWGLRPRQEPKPAPALPAPASPAPVIPSPVVSAAEPPPDAPPAPPPRPKPLDRVAVARAEAALDAASRDRARAEARAEDAARKLAEASASAALAASRSRTLGLRLRDPSFQVSRVSSRGAYLRAERDRLKTEIATLARMPRPKAKSLVDKNPVAKPTSSDEFHFELRRDRVSFIDLDRLIELVKKDALVRIRLSDNDRIVDAKVGPVGAFSLHYALGRSVNLSLNGMLERQSLSYDMRGWEVVPEFEGRGETYAMARQPISEYARAINRLTPGRATITMWVYPDGFALFRKLRDDLHARGFMVAARPLPEGMAIRGSPSGSLSAGQ